MTMVTVMMPSFNLNGIMKNLVKLAGCFVLATALFACNREVDENLPANGEIHWVKVTASPDVATRTTLVEANRNTVWSDEDINNIHLYENGVAPNQDTFMADIDEGNLLMMAAFSGTTPFKYTSILAYDMDDENFVATVPDGQVLLAGTFDPNADILVAKPQEYKDAQEEFMFQYARVVAVNKMTIKGLTNGDEVQEVVISSDKPILGSYNMNTNEWTNEGDRLVLSAKDGLVASDGSVAVYFITAPVEGAILTINVRTASKTYEKTFTKAINFPQNTFTTFATSVEGCEVEPEVAPRGTVLFAEPFTGFAADAVPTAPGTAATVYNSASISYASSDAGTKIYDQNTAGGTAPELLVKSRDKFTISGIPTGGHTSLTVSWNSNNTNIKLVSETDGVTVGTIAETESGSKLYQTIVSVPTGVTAVKLSFSNTTSNNGRLDNINVLAGEPLAEAGLAFSVAETITAILGEDFEEPTLTNEHNLQVTYSSSNTDVAVVDDGGNVTLKAVGSTTIFATSEPTEEYAQGLASYSISVNEAQLTVDQTTTPEKAECKEDAIVTFNVVSNIAWTPTVETDQNQIVKSISVNDAKTVVTVAFKKNEAANEKTAVIAITPDKTVHASLKKTITVTQREYSNMDVLTYAWTGISGSSYQDWTNKNGSMSNAVYAGNSCAGSNITYIQLRNTSNSGIVSTTSGGVVRKVEIVWNSSTTAGRYITVYGRNNAYQGPSDLYNASTRGTELGTIVKGTSTELVINDDDYAYVGLLASAAVYADEIHITWGTADPNKPRFRAEISGDANIAADVTTGSINVTGNVAWTASASNGASVSPASGSGEGTITVTMPENTSYTDPASYVVTVSTQAEVSTKTFNLTFTQAPAVDPNQNDGSAEKPYTVEEALAIINSGNIPTTAVHVAGKISKVESFNSSYHSITYYISDDGTSSNELMIYGGKNLGNKNFDSMDDLSVNDNVVVCGKLKLFNSTPEMDANNYLYSLNGYTKLLYSISVSGQTTSFAQDDPFVFGGTVTATYTDNTTADVTNSQNVSFSGYNMSNTGSQEVTVSYTEDSITKTTQYTISVGGDGPDKWDLVNSLSDMTSGSYIIAALNNEKYYTVPNTSIDGQTFTCSEASYSEDSGLTPANGYGEFTFTKVDGVDNAYYIYNTTLGKYLVATGSKKFGYVDSDSTDYGYWTFSTVSSGGFSGVFSITHSSKTHYMRAYNNSVRCYDGASNNGVYLFVKN